MEEDQSNLDLVESYLEDKMTSIEKEAFEKRVKEDSEFRKEVLFYTRLVAKIKEKGEGDMRRMLKDLHKKNFGPEAKQVNMYYRIAAALALLFVFSGLAYFLFFSDDPTNRGGEYLTFQKQIVADDGSLGFTEGNERIESIVVKIEKSEEETAYQFTDTLRLKLPELPAEEQLKLEYLTTENVFVLTLEGKTYKCYKGFNYYQPLEHYP